MIPEHSEILNILTTYLEENPGIRFGQALWNLKVIEFKSEFPWDDDYALRDIHADKDSDILNRIKNSLQ
jgi:hypothetical protein